MRLNRLPADSSELDYCRTSTAINTGDSFAYNITEEKSLRKRASASVSETLNHFIAKFHDKKRSGFAKQDVTAE